MHEILMPIFWESSENIINLSPAEFVHCVQSVKYLFCNSRFLTICICLIIQFYFEKRHQYKAFSHDNLCLESLQKEI